MAEVHYFGLAGQHFPIFANKLSAISGDRIILDSPFDAEREEDLVSHFSSPLMVTVCWPRIQKLDSGRCYYATGCCVRLMPGAPCALCLVLGVTSMEPDNRKSCLRANGSFYSRQKQTPSFQRIHMHPRMNVERSNISSKFLLLPSIAPDCLTPDTNPIRTTTHWLNRSSAS